MLNMKNVLLLRDWLVILKVFTIWPWVGNEFEMVSHRLPCRERYMCVMESFTIYASLFKKERKQLLLMKHMSKKPHQFSQQAISYSCSTHLSRSKNLILKDTQFFICVFMHVHMWSTCFFSENVYRHVGKAIACLLLLLKEKQTCDLELFILIELLWQEKHLCCS